MDIDHNIWQKVAVHMKWPTHEHIRTLINTVNSDHLDINTDVLCMSWGNPHAVSFDPYIFKHRHTYSKLWQSEFPEGINLSFAQIQNPTEITLHVYERGCGWTLACGTGACATVIAAWKEGHIKVEDGVQVHLPGGTLTMMIDEVNGVSMIGNGNEVFTGELDLNLISNPNSHT